MGRNKIKIEKIVNDRSRNITYLKRKKGLIKKALELSVLCGTEILLCIKDKKADCIVYHSFNQYLRFVTGILMNDMIPKTLLSNNNLTDEDLESSIDENEARTSSEQILGKKRNNKVEQQSKEYSNSEFVESNIKLADETSNNNPVKFKSLKDKLKLVVNVNEHKSAPCKQSNINLVDSAIVNHNAEKEVYMIPDTIEKFLDIDNPIKHQVYKEVINHTNDFLKREVYEIDKLKQLVETHKMIGIQQGYPIQEAFNSKFENKEVGEGSKEAKIQYDYSDNVVFDGDTINKLFFSK